MVEEIMVKSCFTYVLKTKRDLKTSYKLGSTRTTVPFFIYV